MKVSNLRKRALAWVLAIMMVLSMVPTVAFADEYYPEEDFAVEYEYDYNNYLADEYEGEYEYEYPVLEDYPEAYGEDEAHEATYEVVCDVACEDYAVEDTVRLMFAPLQITPMAGAEPFIFNLQTWLAANPDADFVEVDDEMFEQLLWVLELSDGLELVAYRNLDGDVDTTTRGNVNIHGGQRHIAITGRTATQSGVVLRGLQGGDLIELTMMQPDNMVAPNPDIENGGSWGPRFDIWWMNDVGRLPVLRPSNEQAGFCLDFNAGVEAFTGHFRLHQGARTPFTQLPNLVLPPNGTGPEGPFPTWEPQYEGGIGELRVPSDATYARIVTMRGAWGTAQTPGADGTNAQASGMFPIATHPHPNIFIHDITITGYREPALTGLTVEQAEDALAEARAAVEAVLPVAPLSPFFGATDVTEIVNAINAVNVDDVVITISTPLAVTGADPDRALTGQITFAIADSAMLPGLSAPTIAPVAVNVAVSPMPVGGAYYVLLAMNDISEFLGTSFINTNYYDVQEAMNSILAVLQGRGLANVEFEISGRGGTTLPTLEIAVFPNNGEIVGTVAVTYVNDYAYSDTFDFTVIIPAALDVQGMINYAADLVASATLTANNNSTETTILSAVNALLTGNIAPVNATIVAGSWNLVPADNEAETPGSLAFTLSFLAPGGTAVERPITIAIPAVAAPAEPGVIWGLNITPALVAALNAANEHSGAMASGTPDFAIVGGNLVVSGRTEPWNALDVSLEGLVTPTGRYRVTVIGVGADNQLQVQFPADGNAGSAWDWGTVTGVGGRTVVSFDATIPSGIALDDSGFRFRVRTNGTDDFTIHQIILRRLCGATPCTCPPDGDDMVEVDCNYCRDMDGGCQACNPQQQPPVGGGGTGARPDHGHGMGGGFLLNPLLNVPTTPRPPTPTPGPGHQQPGQMFPPLPPSGQHSLQLNVGSTAHSINGMPGFGLETAPVIINGRTMVPFRFIGETLGAEVDWIDETRTATFSLNGRFVSVTIGQALYEHGLYMGTPVYMGTPMIDSTSNRTLVPARFVATQMGAEVDWLPPSTVVIRFTPVTAPVVEEPVPQEEPAIVDEEEDYEYDETEEDDDDYEADEEEDYYEENGDDEDAPYDNDEE